MSRTTPVILLMIGVGAIAAGTYAALRPDPSIANAVYERKVEALQRVAERACRCERVTAGTRDKGRCWAELDRVLPPGNDSMTACFPISQAGRCGGSGEMTSNADGSFNLDSGPCVTTRYNYLGSHGEALTLCSKDEARMVENSCYDEARPDAEGHISTPRTDQLARDTIAGRPSHRVDGPNVCSG